VFPDSAAAAEQNALIRSPIRSCCEPHREFIEAAIARGRNGKAIWQDLVDYNGFTGHYESVKRFIRKVRPTARVAHPRITTEPGEEGQVDYGTGPMVRDPATGKHRRTRLFALTLGCSRKSVWLLAWKSSAKVWSELHERAFRRLGGALFVSPMLRRTREAVGARAGAAGSRAAAKSSSGDERER
jgi:transposase